MKCDTCGREDIVVLDGFHRFIFCQWCNTSEKMEYGEPFPDGVTIITLPLPCHCGRADIFRTDLGYHITEWRCPDCGSLFYYDDYYGETLREHPDHEYLATRANIVTTSPTHAAMRNLRTQV